MAESPGRFGVLRDIGYVSFGKYGQYVITLVTLPLIARQLGTHGVGLLAIGMSAYFIGSLAVDLGITSFLAAKVHDDDTDADLGRLRGTYLAIRVTTLTVLGAALLAGLALEVRPQVHMILLGLFAGGVWSSSEDWLLIGQGRFGTSTLYQGAGRIGYLILLVALLPRFPSASTAMLCLLLSSLLTVALTWWDAVRTFGIPGRPVQLRRVLRIGAPVVASRTLVTSYGQGSAAVYSAVLDAASLGLYSAGDRLVRAIQSLLDPIGFALLPRLARRRADDSFWRGSSRSLAGCVVAALIAVLGVWVAAPLLIHIMFGSAFAGAVPLLRVEVLILPATTITSFVTTAVLPVRQDTAGVLIGAVLGTAVAAGALIVAIQTQSVWTLVYGTVCAEVAVALWYLARMRWLVLRERASRAGAGHRTIAPVLEGDAS
ncbi:lipopolysaccharide biosynthesis protein [Nocardia sp. CDC159]|uniref:Lipopolysaccharide biosynthesis protein n=1 Tax=Nocardia pulmonis TaxID=2951408 RepID=A0A9X2E318_9NOCA|nr:MULTISPECIES: lipopolysaccharide biosynthesis protein [Nocardia]MCM6772173.1 lipopolysaccharide biosynthesis protein [Nocardia pulmonis]MCM6785169.1 lipopolysaccharide biosynthesis protein [Nocardia sp. CDC159]